MLRTARRGFTMIELLIGMAIALFVVAALYGLFIVQSRQFLYQDMQMEMHQNLRFGVDTLTRSARLAGLGTSGLVAGWGGITGPSDTVNSLPAMQSFDNWSGAGHDAFSVVYAEPSLMLSTSITRTPQCETDSLYVLSDLGDHEDKLPEYTAGELLLCMDYASIFGMESYIWVITSLDGSDPALTTFNVASNAAYSDYAALCPTGENLTPVMACSKAQVVTFYIDDTDDGVGPGSPKHPTLMMDVDLGWPEADDVPLVENVEDLQVAWCLNDASDSVSCADASSWTDSLDMTAGDVPWMVRISMVARSPRQDPADTYPGSPIALENHSPSSTTDNYYRKALTTEVTVRNLRIQSVL